MANKNPGQSKSRAPARSPAGQSAIEVAPPPAPLTLPEAAAAVPQADPSFVASTVLPPVLAEAAADIVAPPAPLAAAAEAPIPAVAPVAPAPAPVAKEKAAPEAAPAISAPTQTVPSATEAPAAPVKEDTIMATTFENAAATENKMADVAEKAKTMFADVNAKGTAAFADINDFSKGNIEAIVESGKIAARGIEALGQDAAEYSRRQFEGATAALKSLSTVKSPTDFFKLHSDYVRGAFDSLVAQTSKNTEAMLKLAGEVAQPISNRVAVAVEKVKIAA